MSDGKGSRRLKAWRNILLVYIGLYMVLRISGLFALEQAVGKQVSVTARELTPGQLSGKGLQGVNIALGVSWWIYTPLRLVEDTFWNKVMSRAEQVVGNNRGG